MKKKAKEDDVTFADAYDRIVVHELKVGQDGKPDTWTGHRASSGWVEIPGTERSNRLEVIAYNAKKRLIVWKQKGEMYWSSIGKQSYAPTEITVAFLSQPKAAYWTDPQDKTGQAYNAERVLQWTPGTGKGFK